MTTYYIDPIDGHDNWDGSTFTLPSVAPYLHVFLGAAATVSTSVTPTTGWTERLDNLCATTSINSFIQDKKTFTNQGATNALLSGSTTLKGAIMVSLKAQSSTDISFVASSTIGESDTSVDASAPAGIQNNDIMLALVTAYSSGSPTPTITAPDGWTQIGTVYSSYTRFSVYWKRCSSESGTYTFSHNGSAGQKTQVSIAAYRNCITTGNPYDTYSETNYTTSNTSLRAAAVTCTKLAGPFCTFAGAEAATAFTGGDEVRVRKSDTKDITIGVTYNSLDVSLPAGTAKYIDSCESDWTAATNITVAYTTSYNKDGTKNMSLTPASAFTTGKMAYKTLVSTLDLSSYKAICFWAMLGNVSTVDLYSIALCSDTTGDVPVATLTLNTISKHGNNNDVSTGISSNNFWYLDYGAALPNNVNSIAIYANSDPGTTASYWDNFCATKSVSLGEAAVFPGTFFKYSDTEPVYAVYYISADDTVKLYSKSHSSKGFHGATNASLSATFHYPYLSDFVSKISSSGSIGNLLTISGGWDTSTNTRTGISFLDIRETKQPALFGDASSYICLEHFAAAINSGGLLSSISSVSTGSTYNDLYAIGVDSTVYLRGCTISNMYCSGGRLTLYGSYYGGISSTKRSKVYNVYSTLSDIPIYATNLTDHDFENLYIYSCCISTTGGAIYLYDDAINNTFKNVICKNSYSAVISMAGPVNNNKFYKVVSEDNASVVYMSAEGNRQAYSNYIYDVTFNDSTLINDTASDDYPWFVNFVRCNGDINDNRFYTDKCVTITQTTTRHTESGTALKTTFKNTTISSVYPVRLPLGVYYLSAGSHTITALVRKDHTSCGCNLVIPSYQVQMATPVEISDSMTVGVDTWEELSLPITTTEDGVVELYMDCWGDSTYSIYVDDIAVS